MTFLFSVIYWETMILVTCASAIVIVSALTGTLNLDGLFLGTMRDGSTYYSPERVQLFAVTLVVAFRFLYAVLHDSRQFPEVSENWLLALGGSHFIFLGGKTFAAFQGKK